MSPLHLCGVAKSCVAGPGGGILHLHLSFSDLTEFTQLVNVPIGSKPGVSCTPAVGHGTRCIILSPFCLLHKAKDVTGHRGDLGSVPSSFLVVFSPFK